MVPQSIGFGWIPCSDSNLWVAFFSVYILQGRHENLFINYKSWLVLFIFSEIKSISFLPTRSFFFFQMPMQIPENIGIHFFKLCEGFKLVNNMPCVIKQWWNTPNTGRECESQSSAELTRLLSSMSSIVLLVVLPVKSSWEENIHESYYFM